MPVTIGAVSTTPFAKTPGFYDPNQDPTQSSLKELGRVNAIVEWNGVVYCAGNFDHVIDNTGTAVDHSGGGYSYISAHRADTGAVINTWTPTIGKRLYAIAVSPDGSTLVAGGDDGLYAWTPLAGPTDTSAPSAISMPSVTGGIRGLYITNTTLFVAGQVTAIASHSTTKLGKITKSGGVWSVAAGFTCSGPSGTVKCCTAKSDASIVVIGGDFNGAVLAYDGSDGSSASWGFNFTTGEGEGANQSCIAMTSDDSMVAMGGDFGQNEYIVTDWTGGGPNHFTNITGGWDGYWYHTGDGNVQALELGQVNGAPVLFAGHHGNFAATAKNTATTTSSPKATGLYVAPWTTTGGDRVAYGDPPAFGNPSNTSTPLKVWAIHQSQTTGNLHVGGDFTSAQSPAVLNSQRRYAMFTATVTGGGGGGGGGGSQTWTVPADGSDDGMFLRVLETATDANGNITQVASPVVGPIGAAGSVPVNTTPPSVDRSTMQPGDTLTWTAGVWTNTPTGETFARQRRQTGGSTIIEAVPITAPLQYTALVSDIGYDLRLVDTTSNGSGTSSPAFSPWTTVQSPPIQNPTVPTITLSAPQGDVTIIGTAGATYHVNGAVVSDSAITSCFVNTVIVAVDPDDGSFATVIILQDGANPVNVVATDADGDTGVLTNTITLVEQSQQGSGGAGEDVTVSSDLARIQRELNQRGLE